MAQRLMLAAKYDQEKVQRHLDADGFLYMQPKIDGMRVAINENAEPISRSGKQWSHKPLKSFCFDLPQFRGFDSEVVSGHKYSKDSFRESMSGLRSEEGDINFSMYVFDHYFMPGDYEHRYEYLEHFLGHDVCEYTASRNMETTYNAHVILCPTVKVTSLEQIEIVEQQHILADWEGSILRRPTSEYKNGRATASQGQLVKLKRFEDAEAIVEGYEPWYMNNNEQTTNDLGLSERSSHQDNKVALERLGAWKVHLVNNPEVKFKIGVMKGITHSDRDRMWQERDSFIGKMLTFSHQGYDGGYDAPRTPVFLNWRSKKEF